MAYARILKLWFPVVFWFGSVLAVGQYRAPLDSQWINPHESKRITNTTNKFDFDKASPLGYSAQKLRANSYDGRNRSLSEKGLWIKVSDQHFLYKDQRVFTLSASKCDFEEVRLASSSKELKKTVRSLNRLCKKSEHANRIISTLQGSENKFTISIVNCIDSYLLVPIPNDKLGVLNNNAYAFQSIERGQNIVDYAPFDQIGSGAEIRWEPRHKTLKLAHELAHAYDANYGLLDDRLIRVYGVVIPAREVRALYHENIIRQELGKQLRREMKNGMKAMIVDGVPHTYPLPVPARH